MLQLHSIFDCRQGPIDFSSGSITVCEVKVHKNFKRVQEQARLPRPFKSLFSLLVWRSRPSQEEEGLVKCLYRARDRGM